MKKIVLLFVVLMTVVFLSVLHPENTVKARDDRPVEKTTEEIVKEIRRTGTSVALQEDGSEIEFEYDPFALEYAKDERGTGELVNSISDALDKPAALKSFVVVEGEDELRKIMAEPLEKWRVFLHPTQRKIVNREYSGPARVLGGAGTGKTILAVYIVKLLTDLCNNRKV